jgi:penicillin V acylase-like amidase (Ntn superfamily)
MKTVFVEHQTTDDSFAVYIPGDDDTEGRYNRLFSYDKEVPEAEAKREAVACAKEVARKIGGRVEAIVYT